VFGSQRDTLEHPEFSASRVGLEEVLQVVLREVAGNLDKQFVRQSLDAKMLAGRGRAVDLHEYLHDGRYVRKRGVSSVSWAMTCY